MNYAPIIAFIAGCLTVSLLLVWGFWSIQWFWSLICEVLKKEDPSGPYH